MVSYWLKFESLLRSKDYSNKIDLEHPYGIKIKNNVIYIADRRKNRIKIIYSKNYFKIFDDKIKDVKNCLFPSTKPDLHFNEKGMWSCTYTEYYEKEIDWKSKEKEFIKLCEEIKLSNKHNEYDCVIAMAERTVHIKHI